MKGLRHFMDWSVKCVYLNFLGGFRIGLRQGMKVLYRSNVYAGMIIDSKELYDMFILYNKYGIFN